MNSRSRVNSTGRPHMDAQSHNEQLEWEFAWRFREHGVPLQAANLPEPGGQRLTQLIQFYRSIDREVYVGALDAIGFNAMASAGSGVDFIAMYLGAFHRLTLYAYQVFADPSVHPHVGDPSVERSEAEVIQQLRRGNVFDIGLLRYMPRDPTRQNAAERVAECACLLLFFHELGHVRGCHLALLAEELGVTEYQEFSGAPITEEGSLLMRALELEADSVAVANSLSMWRHLAASTGRHVVEGLGATQTWVMGAELLFYAMSFAHQQWRPDTRASHPSIATRYFNLRFYRGQNGQEDVELASIVEARGFYLAEWVHRHKLTSPLLDYFTESDSAASTVVADEWSELHREIERRWDRLEGLQRARFERLATSH